MFKWLYKIRIGWHHAAYHRYMKRADQARQKQDIVEFKKYIYQAEDAWRKIIILTEKQK
jgi:hypothetical protein